jgi:hypothetical protein
MEPATCLLDAMDHSVSMSDSYCDGVEFENDDDDDDDDSRSAPLHILETTKLDDDGSQRSSRRSRRQISSAAAAADHLLTLATVLDDARQLFHIALPCILMQVSLYWIFPVSSSTVGRTLGTYVSTNARKHVHVESCFILVTCSFSTYF